MDETERKELRAFYMREYKIKTGISIVCMERNIRLEQCTGICMEHVLPLSAKYMKDSVENIASSSRKAPLVEIRRMIVAIMREYKIEYRRIAEVLGGRDHSTMIHAMDEHSRIMSVDKSYKVEYREYRKYVKDEILKLYYEKKEK